MCYFVTLHRSPTLLVWRDIFSFPKTKPKCKNRALRFWKKCNVTLWQTPSFPLVFFGDTVLYPCQYWHLTLFLGGGPPPQKKKCQLLFEWPLKDDPHPCMDVVVIVLMFSCEDKELYWDTTEKLNDILLHKVLHAIWGPIDAMWNW